MLMDPGVSHQKDAKKFILRTSARLLQTCKVFELLQLTRVEQLQGLATHLRLLELKDG